jgi:hypothetical protein
MFLKKEVKEYPIFIIFININIHIIQFLCYQEGKKEETNTGNFFLQNLLSNIGASIGTSDCLSSIVGTSDHLSKGVGTSEPSFRSKSFNRYFRPSFQHLLYFRTFSLTLRLR